LARLDLRRRRRRRRRWRQRRGRSSARKLQQDEQHLEHQERASGPKWRPNLALSSNLVHGASLGLLAAFANGPTCLRMEEWRRPSGLIPQGAGACWISIKRVMAANWFTKRPKGGLRLCLSRAFKWQAERETSCKRLLSSPPLLPGGRLPPREGDSLSLSVGPVGALSAQEARSQTGWPANTTQCDR